MTRKRKVEAAVSGVEGGVRFDRIDGSLQWLNVKYFGSELCVSCAAEKHGICWVRALNIPSDGKCNLTTQEIDEWRSNKERL